MVGNFSDGDGGVAVVAEVGWERGVFRVLRALEQSSISGGSVGSGEECVAGGTASWSLDVVAGEGSAAGG